MIKSGYIAIVGRTSVGKSTFLNNYLGEKVSITSNKPQTTREQIIGIKTLSDAQFVFIDTPGFHKPKHQLGNYLSKEAISGLNSADLVLYMVDKEYSFAEDYVIRHLKNLDVPVLLVINKIDLLTSKPAIDKIIISYLDKYDFKGVFPISSKAETHFEHLTEAIKKFLKPQGYFYEKDQVTTQTELQRAAEIIREKILFHTEEEVPHAVGVVIEYARMEGHLYVMYVTIYVERDSQKGILIGKGGKLLKQIGTESRLEINEILETKVHLNLYVKVKKGWRNNLNELRGLGYV